MYSLPRDKLLTNCPDYSRLVPGTPGYSYTKSKYFRPYVNCGRTRDIYCDRVCRNLCNESSTNYAESTNYETTYRAGAVEDYRQDEFQNCHTGTPGTVTGKIQEILQHYGADQLKCDDLLYRYKISGCASSNSGRSIPGKAVRFASEIEQIGSQLGGEIGNQLGGHIGSEVGPSKLRSAEVMDAKERYDHYARNIMDVMKLNNYMNEPGNSKSRASDQASSHEYSRSYAMPKDVHEHSRTHPMLAESTTEAEEKDVTVGSYTNIGLLKTVLKTVHDEASANKTYTNNSVQCNTRDRLPNQNQKKENLDDQLDMSKKIRTLFEKMNEKLSSHCTYDVCNSSKTLVQTNTGMRKGCLSPIVTSRKDNSSNRTMSLKNSAPKKFNCNKFTQNGPKLSENNCAKPRKVCSKKLTLYCDPQCQKLKKKIENIHKGHAEREPFYSFCGKMRQRSKMSHPLLDRKCRSRTKGPQFGNKTAIIKTLDSTKISIKANTLVINCTKENYPNVLNKIKMMELSLTGTDTTHVSDGNGKDDGNGMDGEK